MENKNFEETLLSMSKPEVSNLKHQEMLANAISRAKDKSVVSWWWLSIPLFVIAMFLMKSVFMPSTTLVSNLHELASKDKITSVLFFLIVPIVFMIFNFITIQKIYFLSGSPKNINFLNAVWFNVLIIFISIFILIIYLF